MPPVLRLYEDVLASDSAEAHLPALPRMIFVAHGAVTIADRTLRDGEAWSGEGAVALKAGSEGATLWRWEMAAGDAAAGSLGGPRRRLPRKAHRFARNVAARARCCCAATASRSRRAAAPICTAIRAPASVVCIEGGIRIDTHGRSTSYGPGGAWYESGPDPVFAQAADRPTRFIRTMILPVAYVGKSSAEYLNEEDKAKPKVAAVQDLRRHAACRHSGRAQREPESHRPRFVAESGLGGDYAIPGSRRFARAPGMTSITSACSRAPCRHR